MFKPGNSARPSSRVTFEQRVSRSTTGTTIILLLTLYSLRMAPRKSRKIEEGGDEEIEDLTTEEPPKSINPYEVLSLEKDATADQIKSAYRKAALKHHPDKASPEDKESAHTKFQEIAFAYAILSDERRRKRYDTTGRTEESLDLEDDDFDWSSYYREQFKDVVTSAAIDKFKSEYQDGEEERAAVLAAYTTGEGDMDAVYEEVMLSNPLEDEERFRAIIDEAIKDGKVDAFDAYTKESKTDRKRRLKRAKDEAKEAEEYAKELGVDKDLASTSNGSKSRKGKKGAASNGADDEYGDTSGLAALIQKRQQSRAGNFLANLEAKYAPKPKAGKKRGAKEVEDEPPEELFEKNRAKAKKAKGKK